MIFEPERGSGPAIHIETLIESARSNPNGKIPAMMKAANVTHIMTGQSRAVAIDDQPHMARAVGLLTCAAVIYYVKTTNQNAKAWIHHANAGQILKQDVERVLAGLDGPRACEVLVLYVQRDFKEDYNDYVLKYMLEKGIIESNILIMPGLNGSTFGIDNRGYVAQ
ncbi:MAG: hypothetical protein U1E52_05135 [Geminicoccaceae bacterium]